MAVNNQLNLGTASVNNQTLQSTTAGVLTWGSTPYITFVKDSNGNNELGFTAVASAVNYLNITNSSTGNAPFLSAIGSDTNVGAAIVTQGSGAFTVLGYGNATSLLSVQGVASAVNYFATSNAATGNPPNLFIGGSDTNVSLGLVPKGTGQLIVTTAATTNPVVIYNGTASQHATTFSMANTAQSRTATFPDFDGTFVLRDSTGMLDSSGVEILGLTHTASAVNYLAIANAATGTSPIFASTGSDSNVAINFATKGTGSYNFFSNGGAPTYAFSIIPVASAVNYIGVTSSITGAPPTLGSAGSDTNVGLTLSTQGTGQLTILTAAPTTPLILYSGTSNQHATGFSMANTSASRTVTFPDATGTLCLNLGGGLLNGTPKFMVYLSGNQSIPTATYTKVLLDTEVFDTNSYFASNRFTPLIAGYYTITANVSFQFGVGDISTAFIAAIFKNGGVTAQTQSVNIIASDTQTISVTTIVSMNGSTDYIEMFAWHSAGANRDVIGLSYVTFMCGSLIV